MKLLLSFITLLLAFSAGAANPDYKAFRGAGTVTVVTNPPNGTIVTTGSSNLTAIAANGATFGNTTSSNGVYLGASGINGILYAYDVGGFTAYKQLLATSPGRFLFGTNDMILTLRGTSFLPELDGVTPLGDATHRWKGGFFTDGVTIGGGTSSASLYDAGGTEYFQIQALADILASSVLRSPSNALAGVMVAQPVAAGTNQWQNLPLTAGQYVTYNGTAYVASNLPPSSAGPTTNSPPQTLGITSGLGSTNILIDMLALGPTNAVEVTLTANAGLMVTNIIPGKFIRMAVFQDNTGNRTIATNATWGFNLRPGRDITGLSLSTNAGYCDLIGFYGVRTNALYGGNLTGYAP